MKIFGRLNNTKVWVKLALSFMVIIIFLIAIGVVGYINMSSINNATSTMYDQRLIPLRQLGSVESAVYGVRGDMYKYVLISGERSIIEQEMNARIAVVEENIKAHRALADNADEIADIDAFEVDWAAYKQALADIITEVKAGNETHAMAMLPDDQPIYSTRMAVTDRLTDMIGSHMNEASATKTDADRVFNNATMIFIILAGFAAVIALMISIVLSRSIASPLGSVAKYAQQIAAGDLTVKIPANQRKDEIGTVIEAFRQMVEMLRRSMSDIAQVVSQLSASASEILASTTQVATSTAETATAISETTATVEEVRQAAQLSAQKAQNVSDNALNVAKTSQNGRQAVDETMVGMDRTREQMDSITQSIVKLSEQSQTIGGIIASVTDIANQSNLLAVNAAIEAVKAGDQGKGFTVVAQEIKSLAEQSKQATMQVRSILSDVQKAASNAAIATEQGSKAVSTSVKLAAQAGESIQSLAESSNEAVEASIQIVASSQQQMVGMDQIGMAMENINQAGIQNVSSMKQLEVAAHNLHEFGHKLQELLAQFKSEG